MNRVQVTNQQLFYIHKKGQLLFSMKKIIDMYIRR